MNKKLSVIGDIYTEEVFKVILDYEIARNQSKQKTIDTHVIFD